MQHDGADSLHRFFPRYFERHEYLRTKKINITNYHPCFLSVLSSGQTNSRIFCAEDGQNKKMCQLHFSKTALKKGSDSIAKNCSLPRGD